MKSVEMLAALARKMDLNRPVYLKVVEGEMKCWTEAMLTLDGRKIHLIHASPDLLHNFSEKSLIRFLRVITMCKMGEEFGEAFEDLRVEVNLKHIPKEEGERRVQLFLRFSIYPVYILLCEVVASFLGEEVIKIFLMSSKINFSEILDALSEEEMFLWMNTPKIPIIRASLDFKQLMWELATVPVIQQRFNVEIWDIKEILSFLRGKEVEYERMVEILKKVPTISERKDKVPIIMEKILSDVFVSFFGENWQPRLIQHPRFHRSMWTLE